MHIRSGEHIVRKLISQRCEHLMCSKSNTNLEQYITHYIYVVSHIHHTYISAWSALSARALWTCGHYSITLSPHTVSSRRNWRKLNSSLAVVAKYLTLMLIVGKVFVRVVIRQRECCSIYIYLNTLSENKTSYTTYMRTFAR